MSSSSRGNLQMAEHMGSMSLRQATVMNTAESPVTLTSALVHSGICALCDCMRKTTEMSNMFFNKSDRLWMNRL